MKVQAEYKYGGKPVGGVAFDGTHVWFSDPAKKAIACVDPATGKIRKRLRGPNVGSGTTWDGKNLWQVGDGKIQCVDPITGKVLRELPVPDKGFISGMAWDGEALWVGAFHEKKLYKIHPKTGKTLRVLNSDRFVTGITWVGEELWHAVFPEQGKPTELRKIDPRTGRRLRRVKMPCTISGLAFDGRTFWCGDCTEGKLRAIRLKSK